MSRLRSVRIAGDSGAADVVRCLVLLAVVSVAFVVFKSSFVGTSLTLAVPYGVVVVGMVLQIGYGRQLALGQVVFMALGAYGVALLNVKLGIAVPIAIAVVVLGSVAVAAVIAGVVARVGGLAIGLVTLFLVIMLSNSIIYSSYLGATTGVGPVAPLLSATSAVGTQTESGIVAAALLAAATLVVVRILRDDVGAEISLLGASDRAAKSVGIRAGQRRIEIFIVGSVLATLGGALFAALQGFVSPTEFDPAAELTLVLMLFLGGQSSVYCALVGPFLIEALPGAGTAIADNITLIEGILFTILLTALPMGIGGLWDRITAGATGRRGQGQSSRPPAWSLPRIVGTVFSEGRLPGGADTSVLAAPQPLQGLRHSTQPSSGVAQPGVAGAPLGPSRRPSPEDEQHPVLRARELTKRFGGVAAVRDVSLSIDGPGVVCLVGPNGAGKSTLLELLSGGHLPDSGLVQFKGRDVTAAPAWQRARMGMRRTFQTIELCDTLDPIENVALAALGKRRGILHPVVRRAMPAARREAADALYSLDRTVSEQLALNRLTLAQERSVELARALVGDPQLVLLDEPASGLSEDQREVFADAVSALGQHLPIVLVEHDLALVAKVAKTVIVLVEGAIIYEGDVAGFQRDTAVGHHLRGLAS